MKPSTILKSVVLMLCFTLNIILLPTYSGSNCFAQVANGTGAGNCLSYNGTSNYVDCGNDKFNTLSTWTIEAWVKRSASTGYHTMWHTGNNVSMIVFDVTNFGGVQIFAGTTSIQATAGSTILINEWHHIAWSMGASSHKVYIDGVEQQVSYLHGNANTSFGFNQIGGTQNNYFGYNNNDYPQYFNGQIDEVSIYNRALTQDEIRATMCQKLKGNETGLVGYWRFDEGSGSTAYDSSPNGNNGTLH